jgi:glycosyltransferase involved in cell wall biosynthesis
MTVSVIVPAKNNGATIEACLKSIAGQSYPKIELIVVVNTDSADGTLKIAKRYSKKVYSQGTERLTTRNFGAAMARGRYLLFIDSDMVLDRNVVGDCVKAIEHQPRGVGVVIPEESFGQGFWARCKQLERSFYVGVDWIEAARFFRKDIFKQIGGYDEKMISGEDWDLAQRAEAMGRIARVQSFIHHNEGAPSLWQVVSKKYYYARHFSGYMKDKSNTKKASKQTGILSRYGLFFSKPGVLFADPVLGLGMLLMKTLEFGFGAIGYIFSR